MPTQETELDSLSKSASDSKISYDRIWSKRSRSCLRLLNIHYESNDVYRLQFWHHQFAVLIELKLNLNSGVHQSDPKEWELKWTEQWTYQKIQHGLWKSPLASNLRQLPNCPWSSGWRTATQGLNCESVGRTFRVIDTQSTQPRWHHIKIEIPLTKTSRTITQNSMTHWDSSLWNHTVRQSNDWDHTIFRFASDREGVRLKCSNGTEKAAVTIMISLVNSSHET
jgi:hypothetical protein